MKIMSISSVNAIYTCSRVAKISIHSVSFPELRSIFLVIDKLLKLLGETSEDPYWYPKIRQLKRFRFDICAAPLTGFMLRRMARNLLENLRINSSIISQVYPEFYNPYFTLIEGIDLLATKKLDYLLDKVVETATEKDLSTSAILIKESRLIPQVESVTNSIASIHKCEIVNETGLREDICYINLFIIGPPSWYSDYIFSAPRSRYLHIIKYNWIRTRVKIDKVFSKPIRQRSSVIDILDFDDSVANFVNPDDILPSLDISRIMSKVKIEVREKELEESVNARLYILEREWAVFLEVDESSSILILDIDEEISNNVIRMKIQGVEVGHYILLRTSGGGDYILPVADRIMGDFANIARKRQKNWKTKLRKIVKLNGMQRVVSDLRNRGSTRANEANIRNWMSFRNIKTQYYNDFQAIMRLIELDERVEEYWRTMEIIDRAHKSAGFHIRKLLLEQVKKSNLEHLKRLGRIDFEMPEKDAGSITAFRVRAIYDDIIPVSTSRIGEPFKMDGF